MASIITFSEEVTLYADGFRIGKVGMDITITEDRFRKVATGTLTGDGVTLLQAFDAKDLRIKLPSGINLHPIVEAVSADGATFRSVGNLPDTINF